MKSVIRKRTEIAECCNMIARHAHGQALEISHAALRAHRRMNPNEKAMYDELEKISSFYRGEATRHIFSATICGNSVLDIRPI